MKGLNKVNRVNFTNAYSVDFATETICIEDCRNIDDVFMVNVESGIKGSQGISNIIASCKQNGAKLFLGIDSCQSVEDASMTGFNVGYNYCAGIDQSYAINCLRGYFYCSDIMDVRALGDENSAGFEQCSGIINGSAIDQLTGYYYCTDISDCTVEADNASAIGFNECRILKNCSNKDTDTMGIVFRRCMDVYSCEAKAGDKGFAGCNSLIFCYAHDITSIAFEGSKILNGCSAADSFYGFSVCEKVTDSKGANHATATFSQSKRLTNCSATGVSVRGFENCDVIEGGYVGGASSSGYLSCTQISNSEASGPAYGFELCDYLSNCKAGNTDSSKTGIPFKNCTHILNGDASNCETGFSGCKFIQGGSVTGTSSVGILGCYFVTNLKLTDIADAGSFSISDCFRLTGCYCEGPAPINPAYGGVGCCKYLVNCEILGISAIDNMVKTMCDEYTP